MPYTVAGAALEAGKSIGLDIKEEGGE